MGQQQARPSTTCKRRESWRATFTSSFTLPPTPAAKVIPADNLFVRIQEDDILGQIPIHMQHPLPRLGIEDSADTPIQTNGFYTNAFLNKQDQPIWTLPYFLWWGKGGSNPDQFGTWGMNIGHVEMGELEFGPGDPPKSFSAPRMQSIILGARELDSETVMTTDNHQPHSVNINLRCGTSPGSPKITFPAVQGMIFITADYQNASPLIQTAEKGFQSISNPTLIGRSTKYHLRDCYGHDWLMYTNSVQGVGYDAMRLTKIDNNTFILPPHFRGTIQVAKNPLGADAEALYDKTYGTFVIEAKLFATATEARGTYGFNYTKRGKSPLLTFILPRHVQSLDPELKCALTKLQLQTPTKGVATAIWADSVTFVEPNLPITMGFSPWTSTMLTPRTRYPPDFLLFLSSVAEFDLRRAMSEATPQDSYYHAGKTLSKFATLIWVIKEVLNNAEWTAQGLSKLKQDMARYINNVAQHPLYYDDTWKGLISRAGLDRDPGLDFGNSYYNDHRFHFGYFIYAAAVIGFLDAGWLEEGDNKKVINMMVKDIAESEYEGRDFPFQRCFDWYHGHTWAKGLFESADGKDEESTGEDGFVSFAIKMWAKVIGNANMEKRGDLMLAVQARSFSNYFYLTSTNPNQPPAFLPHKIAGISFENKVSYTYTVDTTKLAHTIDAAHTTPTPHLIHAIHMLPITPATAYLRPRPFVREEWDAFFNPSPPPQQPPPSAAPNPTAQTPLPRTTSSTSTTSTSTPSPNPPLPNTTTPHQHQSHPKDSNAKKPHHHHHHHLVEGAWRGILFANLAVVDARSSYAFFREGVKGVWDERWVGAGATRSWYLVWCAALGGVGVR